MEQSFTAKEFIQRMLEDIGKTINYHDFTSLILHYLFRNYPFECMLMSM